MEVLAAAAGDWRSFVALYSTSSTKTGENLVNTIAADGLAPWVARPSAAMVLNMQDKQVLVFHEEGFQLPVSSQWWEIIENANMYLLSFVNWICHARVKVVLLYPGSEAPHPWKVVM